MRQELDFYATPDDLADAGADLVRVYAPFAARVLDPAAGDGALLRALGRRGIENHGLEIDEERARSCSADCRDALSPEPWPVERSTGCVFMNPPFSASAAFVGRALRECSTVIALLPIAFLASRGRRDLFAAYGMPRVAVIERRPRFLGNKSAHAEYMFAIWALNGPPGNTRIELPDPPPRVRKVRP